MEKKRFLAWCPAREVPGGKGEMLLVLHVDAVRLRCVEFFDPFFLQSFPHECVVLGRLIDTGDGNVVCPMIG